MDDLISRAAAIDAAVEAADEWDGGYSRSREEIITLKLRMLPSAQPERPSGKWLSHYDYCKRHGYIPSGMMAFWWCDQCEQGVGHTTKFCPHCGARMRPGLQGKHFDSIIIDESWKGDK